MKRRELLQAEFPARVPARALSGAMPTATAWTAVLLLAALPACAPEGQRDVDGVSRPVLDVPPATSIAPVRVHDQAWEQQCQMEPIGGNLARRITLLELLSVDRARIQSDRGEEVVRLSGLGGSDPRLPEEARTWLEGEAREAMLAWLEEPDYELVEVSPPRFARRGVAAGPHLLDRDGLRVASIGRRERGKPVMEVGLVALQNGWAWPSDAGEDALALDPRLPLVRGTEHSGGEGLFAVPEVVELVEEYRAEALAVAELTEEELSVLGRRLHGELASWLDWQPSVELRFRSASPGDARGPLRAAIVERRGRLQECFEEDARQLESLSRASGSELTVDLDLELPPLSDELDGLLATAHGFSPAGPEVWVVQRGDLTLPLFELALLRELVREYQEERLSPDGGYPICGLPVGLEEAHASWVASRFRGFEGGDGRLDGDGRAFRMYGEISDRLGLGLHGLLEGFAAGEFDAGRWQQLVEGDLGLQEWFFREEGTRQWEGVRFEPIRSPDHLPRVRITNERSERLEAQFQGQWLWRVEGKGRTIANLAGAPFNLELEPGGAIVLELAREAFWRDLAPERMVGLFSRSSLARRLVGAPDQSR